MKLSIRASAAGLLAAACLGMACAPAHAAPASDLKDWGAAGIFGRYGPGGDCTGGPVIQIDETGLTYEVAGETIHPATFEIAHTFWGNFYEGIQTVFMPFVRSANDYGNSIMIVNAEEVEGKVTFESNGSVSAAEQALAGASPYMRCGAAPMPAAATAPASAPAAASAIPLDWTSLPRVEGSFDVPFDMFGQGEIAEALRALIGGRMAVLERNLSVRGPIGREGSIYHISGNAQHLGGEEQAYVLMDAARKRVQVGLWEKGRLAVYAPQQGRLFMPAEIDRMLLRSPPEDAVALPGTPWEVIQTSDGLPLATVDAAGSPDIRSFSLFCDQGRPKLAMLLNKPHRGNSLTSSWVFSGRLVDVAMGRGNGEGTFWLAWLDGSPLPQMLVGQSGEAFLRIDGGLQGQASLRGSSAVVRGVLSQCLRL